MYCIDVCIVLLYVLYCIAVCIVLLYVLYCCDSTCFESIMEALYIYILMWVRQATSNIKNTVEVVSCD